MSEKILEGIKLSKTFYTGSFFSKKREKVVAVDDVSFYLLKGKTLGLVGESGCGKSTLCKLILKFIQPDRGKILFKGKDVTSWKEKDFKRVRKKIQIVFQDPYSSLNPRLKIKNTLKDGLKGLRLTKKEEEQEIGRLLEIVGLSSKDMNKYPHEFSGGQRQRICIARALSVRPEVILCDEPVSALDVSVQAQILNLFLELQKKFGLSYLFISHDLNVVGYLSDFICVMYKGEIVEYASCEELFSNPMHPYTQNLLKASLDLKSEGKILLEENIDVKGCKFAKRCQYVSHICKKQRPELKIRKKYHLIRCFLA